MTAAVTWGYTDRIRDYLRSAYVRYLDVNVKRDQLMADLRPCT